MASVRERTPLSVRFLLRRATADAHERMHAHPGFNAAATGAIQADDYRRLLSRLLGFHRPFEGLVRVASKRHDVDLDFEARARSPLLVADLLTLGVSQQAIDNVSEWAPSLKLGSDGAVLGSLYVLEGSNSRRYPDCTEPEKRSQRRDTRGAALLSGPRRWKRSAVAEFAARLETLAGRQEACEEAVASALATFGEFELWMAGWTSTRAVTSFSPLRRLPHEKV